MGSDSLFPSRLKCCRSSVAPPTSHEETVLGTERDDCELLVVCNLNRRAKKTTAGFFLLGSAENFGRGPGGFCAAGIAAPENAITAEAAVNA